MYCKISLKGTLHTFNKINMMIIKINWFLRTSMRTNIKQMIMKIRKRPQDPNQKIRLYQMMNIWKELVNAVSMFQLLQKQVIFLSLNKLLYLTVESLIYPSIKTLQLLIKPLLHKKNLNLLMKLLLIHCLKMLCFKSTKWLKLRQKLSCR